MSAEAALQEVIYKTLRDDPEVAAFVNGRIYDRVPLGAARPYIHLADTATTALPADCTDCVEVLCNIDIWSESLTKVQANDIAREVAECLHEKSFALDAPYSLIDLRRLSQTTDDEGQGLYRCRMLFRALIDRMDEPGSATASGVTLGAGIGM